MICFQKLNGALLRVCVYTAIFGSYDKLKLQPRQSLPTDFVCFSDSVAAVEPWAVIRSSRLTQLNPRMRAKYFKVLSHRVFPSGRLRTIELLPFGIHRLFRAYDYIIWIDGSIQIKTSQFTERVVASIHDSGWCAFRHPDRNCIYDELIVSESMTKYQHQPMSAQVKHYQKEGFPKGAGLWAMGVIGRRVTDPRLKSINEAWWKENLEWSYQDQLSIPVILWRLNLQCDVIPGNLWSNELIAHNPHLSEQ